MEKENAKSDNLTGRDSVLNVEAQKELIDYRMKVTQKFVLKTYLIIFPLVLLLVAGVIFLTTHFLGR